MPLLRIPRNDTPDPDHYVLLHLAPTTPTHPLDLHLHATEGERAFSTKLKHTALPSLRAKSYTGTPEGLTNIFSFLLLKTPIPHLPRGLELAASVGKDSITLTIRQDVSGIKQRIAALKIPETETEIPIFDWTLESCATLDTTTTQLQTLQSRITLQEAEIAKLTSSIKTLVQLKKEHEQALLSKFVELLNSKKAKIRELSQALEGAISTPTPGVDDDDDDDDDDAESSTVAAATATAAGPSESAGRKRKSAPHLSDSESDGFVKMDIDKGKSTAAAEDEDEDEDEEGGDYLRGDELGQSDRSMTEDEEELPPIRRPFEAFTLRAPEKGTPEPEVKVKEEVVTGGRERGGRVRGGGKGKGKEPARGGGMATRSRQKEPSPGVESAGGEGTGEDSDDDEL